MAVLWRYLGAYLLGIITSVFFTPVELFFSDVFLGPWFFLGCIPGVFVWFYLVINEPELLRWSWVSVFALAPVLGEIWVRLPREASELDLSPTFWRPFWIAFPIGLLGSLGVFFAIVSA